MASRFGSRFFSFARSGPTIHARAGPFASSPAFRARFTQQARNGGGHRWNSGGPGAGAAGSEEAQQSFWKRTWNSPIGVRTVHFWAPVMKWILVLAGISDMTRPAEKLSLTQNAALMATGLIWTRWCLIIKPRNVLLATVNFFVGCVGLIQVGRIYNYKLSVDGKTAEKQEAASEKKE